MLSLLWPIKIFSFPIITQSFYTDTSVLSCPSNPGAPPLPSFTLPVQTHLLTTCAHMALVSSFLLAPEQDSFSTPSTHVGPLICKVLIFPSNAPWNLPSQPLLVSLCFECLKNSVCTPQLNTLIPSPFTTVSQVFCSPSNFTFKINILLYFSTVLDLQESKFARIVKILQRFPIFTPLTQFPHPLATILHYETPLEN